MRAAGERLLGGGELIVGVVEQVQRGEELLHVVLALGPSRRLTRGLHGGQQQRDQDANNGDHDQQFHQRKAGRPPPPASFALC